MNSRWSHAGGVVVRMIDNEPHYLLVEASDNRGMWVLPKGKIKQRETPEAAAVREIIEEAGVRALIVSRAGESEYQVGDTAVRVVFFLMQYQGELERSEDRGLAWRRYQDAIKQLHFENTRRILMQAHALNN